MFTLTTYLHTKVPLFENKKSRHIHKIFLTRFYSFLLDDIHKLHKHMILFLNMSLLYYLCIFEIDFFVQYYLQFKSKFIKNIIGQKQNPTLYVFNITCTFFIHKSLLVPLVGFLEPNL